MSIALFEDLQQQNFAPLTLTRATFDVKVGARSFFEEYKQAPEILLTREYLAGITGERHVQCKVNPESVDNDTIFVNGLLHPGAIDVGRLLGISHTFAITAKDRLVVARIGKKDAEYLQECVAIGKKINVKKFDVEKSTQLAEQDTEGLLSEPWDIIRILENSIAMQVSDFGQRTSSIVAGVRVLGKGTVIIDQDAEIGEGSVLDARNGGIYIGPEAHIAPSRISGPAYIGGKTQVKQFTIIDA